MTEDRNRFTDSIRMARAVLAVAAAMLATAAGASAQCLPGTYVNDGALLDGAAYTIKIPNAWNGTLLVYARQFDITKPTVADAFWHGGGAGPVTAPQDFETPLLAAGYALAGSTLRGGGWVVAEGLQDLSRLSTIFRTNHCVPTRTIVVGFDMGALIALKSMEANRRSFDGAVAACAPAAGMTRIVDRALRQNLAIAATLEWPAAWGAPGDIRDDLPPADVQAVHYLGPAASERLLAAFEFERNLLKIEPPEIYYGTANPARVSLLRDFLPVVAALERRFGGPVAQSVTQRPFSLTPEQLFILDFLIEDYTPPLPPCDPADAAVCPLALQSGAAFLDALNAIPSVSANPTARARLAATSDLTGLITGPVLLLHTAVDPLFPSTGTTAYLDTLTARGRQDRLLRVFTQNRPGHCEFNPGQLVGAIGAMRAWLDTGVRPLPQDQTFFPIRDGFNPAYRPDPWPF